MKNTEDLKIIGIDKARPPMIRKEPYIDLVFELSEKANMQWCKDFNELFSATEDNVKINLEDCLYIETWVRTMDEIPKHFINLKTKVSQCNQIFKDRQKAITEAANNKNKTLAEEQGPQGQLNNIISKLNFN